ncbi:PREDICTED: 1-acyl-sn-glycerol-3-phosphate acyltransferase alpha-like [Gekko japonicus]|uniref:1-acyl-sn-glycerol-3-phosphate acyltransferase n=1 Tax=Gekko japonicus TaxID=146911 RepID=A0ABM1JPN0_GEKJA|nr:PREDICTED: 1-acyl-sn-glycerol-3-phosphate acyltransferase alpha-like [Gekko japonicus]
MDLFQWSLLLFSILVIGISLLYRWSTAFNFHCKMALFFGWCAFWTANMSIFLSPILRRNPDNMKLLRTFIWPLKRFYGIKIAVQGSENLNMKEPYVMVCNHQTYLDLLGMMEIIPDRCVPVAKRELLYLGLVGHACWLSGMIFIDRRKKDEAREILRQAAQTMWHENMRIWVYPEGTRNKGKTLLPFKRGAFHLAVQAQVPIIPVVISSYRDFYCSKEKRFTAGNLKIRILPKVDTKDLGPEDIPALTDSIHKRMQDTYKEICGGKDVKP